MSVVNVAVHANPRGFTPDLRVFGPGVLGKEQMTEAGLSGGPHP